MTTECKKRNGNEDRRVEMVGGRVVTKRQWAISPTALREDEGLK
jgi:hypothetical protein